jgi:hypothetical protein
VRYQVFAAVVGAGKVDDGVLKCSWLKDFHDSILSRNR